MPSRRLSVAVIQGGPSTEAEVSRASAAGVCKALEEAGHRVVRLELDAFLAESLRTGGYDVVFPVVHGAVGEDGSLQGLLEVLELPYVGSGVLASALAMHKRVARVLFGAAGLPVARGIVIPKPGAARQDEAEAEAEAALSGPGPRKTNLPEAALSGPGPRKTNLPEAALSGPGPRKTNLGAATRARREVGAALVVKPSSHGSAIGVTRIEAEEPTENVLRALEAVWAIDDFAVVEEFVHGREVTCGVLEEGGGGAIALPPTEILAPSDAFYTYAARYAAGRSQHVCPAQLAPDVLALVQRVAVQAHETLGCRDLSRVDFVVCDDGPRHSSPVALLEVNTLPGMTATSLFPEAAAAHGLPMPCLCDSLVVRAHERGPTRRNAPLPLPR
jgi:D-alanine-D-alanine ligase